MVKRKGAKGARHGNEGELSPCEHPPSSSKLWLAEEMSKKMKGGRKPGNPQHLQGLGQAMSFRREGNPVHQGGCCLLLKARQEVLQMPWP